MPAEEPCPSTFVFAQGAQFSVTREQVMARPRSFFEGLMDELRAEPTTYTHVAFLLEPFWPYVFFNEAVHAGGRSDEFCPDDVVPFPDALKRALFGGEECEAEEVQYITKAPHTTYEFPLHQDNA